MNSVRMPLIPHKVAQKREGTIFRLKVYFSRRNPVAKFLHVETFRGKAVRHSLAYQIAQEWLVGDVPFYLKFWAKLTHPLQKRRLSINIRL